MGADSDGHDLLATLLSWWLGAVVGAVLAGGLNWVLLAPGVRPGQTPYGWVGYLVVTAAATTVGAVLGGGGVTGWWLAHTGRAGGWLTALACVGVSAITVGCAALVGLWTAVPGAGAHRTAGGTPGERGCACTVGVSADASRPRSPVATVPLRCDPGA